MSTYKGAVFHQSFHEEEEIKLLRLIELMSRPSSDIEIDEFVGLVRDAIRFSTYLPPYRRDGLAGWLGGSK